MVKHGRSHTRHVGAHLGNPGQPAGATIFASTSRGSAAREQALRRSTWAKDLEAYRFRRQLYYATCAILVSIPSSYSEGVRYPSPF